MAKKTSGTKNKYNYSILDESDVYDGLRLRCLWQHYEFIEHLVRLAKAQALLKLQQSA